MSYINIFGLIVVVLLLIPNIRYAYKNKNLTNHCTSKMMNIIEQIGRYGSMFLMTFHIGIAEFGFRDQNGFTIWIVSMAILMLLYWLFWLFYFRAPKMGFAITLAVIPSILFLLSGFLLRHWLLIVFGAAFSVGHITVTYQNSRTQ